MFLGMKIDRPRLEVAMINLIFNCGDRLLFLLENRV
jgi:hypothetical protein